MIPTYKWCTFMTVQCSLDLCYSFDNIFKPRGNWLTWCKFGHLNCNNTCMSIKACLFFYHILSSATIQNSQFRWKVNKKTNTVQQLHSDYLINNFSIYHVNYISKACDMHSAQQEPSLAMPSQSPPLPPPPYTLCLCLVP